MNTVNLLGRITVIKNGIDDRGIPYVNFGVADNQRAGNSTPQFFTCVAFGPPATAIVANMDVGDRISVTGRMEWQSWKKNNTAPTMRLLKIIVYSFEMAGRSATRTCLQWPGTKA